ncbi:MAG: hypothetical protein Kow0049_26740 [Stanieria sp.]
MNYNHFLDNSFLPKLIDENALIAGVDEVGRGALFGSVVAAVIVLPASSLSKLSDLGVKDSKQLSAKKRQQVSQLIQVMATDWQIASASVAEIDRLNIFHASLLAMKRAVIGLKVSPVLCLVDGKFPIPELSIEQKTIVQGDRCSALIAAASILAKVWRDELIVNLANDYPEYDLVNNKGYPTNKHRLALRQYGLSLYHRTSFRPCQLEKKAFHEESSS